MASAYLPPMVHSEGSKSKLAGSLLVQGDRAPGTSPGSPLTMSLQLLLSPSMMWRKKKKKKAGLVAYTPLEERRRIPPSRSTDSPGVRPPLVTAAAVC